MIHQQELRFSTTGRGTYDISKQIETAIKTSGIKTGTCQIFLQHTSASLILCENVDPSVREDLETFMSRLVPDGDKMFKHTTEGTDDMPAHVRATLTQNSITIPVSKGKSNLGLWQGVFLWEHRTTSYKRNLIITINGDQ